MSKILYVDDHPIRDPLSLILEEKGYEVGIARNGLECIELARLWKPDFIFLDLRMPRMDGFEATKVLRQNPRTANIPVFVLSAWSTREHRELASSVGANEYFVKPVDLNRLLNKINSYLPEDKPSTTPTLDVNSYTSGQATQDITPRYVPYVVGLPIIDPQKFFGRQADIQKIIGLLTDNFVMVIGARRIGKTSLLHQLVYHLAQLKNTPEEFIPVLVNLEGTPETEFFHTVMEDITDTVQHHLPAECLDDLSFDLFISTYSARVFSRDLQTILKNLQNTSPKSSRLVLLLDEMDTLNSYNLATQSQLRRVFQRFTNRNLSVVVAGVNLQKHWAGESSPFYNMFMPIRLTPFPEAEARRLITEPVEGVYNYSDKAVTRILEATTGLPHRIQQLCLETIYTLSSTSPERNEVSGDDVDAILQTIQWLDEETPTQNEVIAPSVSRQELAITEGKAPYRATDSVPNDQEAE